jgi:hypothetical protein
VTGRPVPTPAPTRTPHQAVTTPPAPIRTLEQLAGGSEEYRRLQVQVPKLKAELDAARRTSDTHAKLDASLAYNQARKRMAQLEDEWRAGKDPK